MHANTLMAIIS